MWIEGQAHQDMGLFCYRTCGLKDTAVKQLSLLPRLSVIGGSDLAQDMQESQRAKISGTFFATESYGGTAVKY